MSSEEDDIIFLKEQHTVVLNMDNVDLTLRDSGHTVVYSTSDTYR